MWIKGPLDVRLPTNKIKQISSSLEQLKTSIPEISYWKATEYRTFLLYVGPLVLESVLKKDLHVNFMTLDVAVRLLTSK